MVGLPTGTVTFLFTDIEGSTRLAQTLGDDRWQQVFADHRRLLQQAVDTAGGILYQDQGESFLVVFQRAKDAVLAAVAAQRALAAHSWPHDGALRVRMGVHSGEPLMAGNDYAGIDLHRAARICAAGHGGQVLLSEATRGLIADGLPECLTLRDLGEYRLKDLGQAQHLYQVMTPDLPADFPALQSLDVRPHNLPVQLTSFIGRNREMAGVKKMLTTARLLTLTGAGGSGKTRLALQVAADVFDQYPDGAWLVELATLSDPTLVPNAVASSLNVPEQRGRPFTETLVDFLHSKSLLLVLDNCEHLRPACAELADRLLRFCPTLRILPTSREPLSIPGEVIWRVPTLSFPDLQRLPPFEHLNQYEAVRLFVDRAALNAPGFAVTTSNALAVAQVCQRLDGIPLAIELAAVRVKALAVQQIASMLDDRFRLLTGGARTGLSRHQTLRATMDWSYDLLLERERTVLRRLSAFAGGWTLEAAEAVCSGDGVDASDILDLLTQLVDKSLVVMETRGEEARYRLLETVRQYGLDRLAEAGEDADTRRRHLNWYMGLAEQADPKLRVSEQQVWLERLEIEHDNLRAALERSMKEAGDAEAGLRLAGGLYFFWFMHGHESEGREWLEKVLSRGADASGSARAKALCGVGILARRQSDYKRAGASLQESLVLFRESGDRWGIGLSLHHLAHVAEELGDYGKATALYEESLVPFREAGHKWGVAASLNCSGEAMQRRGDYSGATPLFQESMTLCREIGDKWLLAYPVRNLGTVAAYKGDYGMATAFLEESLAIGRGTGDKWGMANSQSTLGNVAFNQGNYERAMALLKESLVLRREVGSKQGVAECLERLAGVAGAQGQSERTARLFGAAEALRASIGAPLARVDRPDYDRNVAATRAGVDELAFATAWADGPGNDAGAGHRVRAGGGGRLG